MQSDITREEWNRYIFSLYFDSANTPLASCINRAYRDFNRTLNGFASLAHNTTITEEVKKYLILAFENLRSIKNQEDFDTWHQEQCLAIQALYTKNNYHFFYIGQAQKWINMTFKYIFAYGENEIKGYNHLYPFCHVPFDTILSQALKNHKPPKLGTSWSRITDYTKYMEYQIWFRNEFKDSPPLDTEFRLWNKEKKTLSLLHVKL